MRLCKDKWIGKKLSIHRDHILDLDIQIYKDIDNGVLFLVVCISTLCSLKKNQLIFRTSTFKKTCTIINIFWRSWLIHSFGLKNSLSFVMQRF